MSQLVKGLVGKLFGDKVDISQPLFDTLSTDVLQLVTKLKKGMKQRRLSIFDKIMLLD